MVPVEGGQNLILAVAVQTVGRAIWNIQATMVECQHVIQEWAGKKTVIYMASEVDNTQNSYLLLQMQRPVAPHTLAIQLQPLQGRT